ncbi:MAG: sigma-70 family RNA polymerase sigma factor [Bacteroidia bacterium]
MTELKLFEQYTESELIREILSGKYPLYEILIRRNNPYLYKIGRSYGYNHHDTEDLMQETYINAYTALKSFEHRAAFTTWLSRIMLNLCYQKKQKFSFKNEQASSGHYIENNTPMFHTTPPTEKTVINKELGKVLEHTLEQLPEDYRMVFTLRELNGLSVAETAGALGISEANVKVRLNRAKTMLRGEIEKIYDPADIYEFNLVYCNEIVKFVLKKIAGST